MTTLKFSDTHNMVAFWAKPAESEGFEQIVDFLNAHTIKYALTVNPTIYTSSIEQFWTNVKKQRSRRSKRKDTKVPQPSGPTTNVADEAVNEEMDDSLVRAATTISSLEAEHDSGNILKTRSKVTPNEAGSQGTTSGGGPRCQDTMKDTIAQTRFENMSKTSNDSLLAGGDVSKQGMKTDDIDKHVEITLVDETQGRYGDDLMFDTVRTADPVTTAGKVVTTASVEISTASPTETIIADDLTLAQTLIEIRNKGKAIMEELEKPTKRKDQIRHDKEVAQRLQAQMQAELDEEDSLVRQKEEANIISWDNMQKMIDTDYQMAQQMQAEEQE
ncbi:hypothetical protein Tco_0738338 [Tanacetum coccineum]